MKVPAELAPLEASGFPAGPLACQGVLVPPSTARGYLQGQHATYHVPTLDDVAQALKQLSVELRTAHAGRRARILHDIDALLDRRRELQEAR